MSRQVYNDTVLSFYNAIQTFPGVVIAGPFGFRREFFETDETQREAPQVDFDRSPVGVRTRAPPRPPSPARVARPRPRRLAFAATFVAALVLPGVAQAQTYELVSSDVQATVRPDGSVAVDEAITVAFSGSFTGGTARSRCVGRRPRRGRGLEENGGRSSRARRPSSSPAARPAPSA